MARRPRTARQTTGGCDGGERGGCDEESTWPDRQGGHRLDWSFRAKSGRHDGCSPDEVELRLERTGARCRAAADDALTPVRRLIGDFHHGRFAPAFPPEQRAAVDEAALATGRLCGPPPPTLPDLEPS